MSYFQNRKNVDDYTKEMEGYDNSFVISEVCKVLPNGRALLELGIGTGADLIALSENYKVVGSDNSKYFIENFKKKSNLEVHLLDARNFNLDRKFDCIYSNKVMEHLTTEEFISSLGCQVNHLSDNGFIFMTLWNGSYREEYDEDSGELNCVYYDRAKLEQIMPEKLIIENIIYYREFEDDDSMILVLRRK